ncbi:AzlC family ABC transporter permease [Brevibacillus sp. 7WMA2]|uniref:AzlC family ABC transporter permease n=1 Tax=Brevibacillus TaxID=55080 RepID=UPI0003B21A8C|nr:MULTISPECIES: AzlC family ABC transporter permease [Brevibacillus]ERM16327.1 branched-chain amino acid permease [Brevibacillus laterosporus PE36]MBA4532666.1 AzlC family ABC transporter permease [Brevibacillus halotolerans]MCR8963748.1 AzlC family ABC transporter permease [Brevibacillus laterosporus]MCR8993825.1 AzlC family ABC transporter permease [Brevibacillus laterosporus]MCZ0835904.1 AzlC family ABC transporter permease [Brevibacillus halotolerans]
MSLSNVQMNSSQRYEDSFIKGVKDCIPTLLGYLSIGIAAGVIQKAAGLSIAEIALISLILYAGSAQFIAAGMMATGSSLTAIIITILFVNLRHILLSAALAPYFRHLSPLRNMLVGSLLTDETFGVAISETAKKNQISEKWMHGLNITAYLNWFVANLAGAFLAQWISNPEKFGLEFALPAMFIGILILTMLGRSKIKLDIVVAIIAVVIAVGSTFLLSSSMGVIVATIIASTIGMVVEKWK